MSGGLFNTSRINKSKYLSIISKVEKNLSDLRFRKYSLEYYITKHLNNKTTFGDVDVIVLGNKKEFKQQNPDFLKDKVWKTNSNVLTYLEDSFPVDLIFTNAKHIRYSKAYHNYGDAGLLFGILVKNLHPKLKWGDKGLKFQFEKEQTPKDFYFFEKSPYQIFLLFGLDYNEFELGFENEKELLNYFAKSPYFTKESFSRTFNKLKTAGKKRISKYLEIDVVENIPKYSDDSYDSYKLLNEWSEGKLEEFSIEYNKRPKKFNDNNNEIHKRIMDMFNLSPEKAGRKLALIKKLYKNSDEINYILDLYETNHDESLFYVD